MTTSQMTRALYGGPRLHPPLNIIDWIIWGLMTIGLGLVIILH